jgi:hypothetical protein
MINVVCLAQTMVWTEDSEVWRVPYFLVVTEEVE